MAETIDLKTVAHVAELARLDPSPEESVQLASELTKIVDYIGALNKIDTDGVEPLHHVLDQHNVLSEDIPSPSLSQEDALSNAPQRKGDFFVVPRVIDN
jgi:aspartyl-tRNA(Asn)/glutamyl-tRNA(Gln) amidotransferase subunit C